MGWDDYLTERDGGAGVEVEQVLAQLEDVHRSGAGWMARCPAHDDGKASLSVKEGDTQPVLLYCHTGCTPREVMDALGMSLGQICTPETAEYPYTDADGKILYLKRRLPGKDFRLLHYDSLGHLQPGRGEGPKVLYNLPAVQAAIADGRTVYVVEGEKDADSITAAGAVATCNFEGASKDGQRPKWLPEYGDQLTGAHLIIVADNDEPGFAHARAIYKDVRRDVASVQIRKGLLTAKGADVTDHLQAGYSLDQLQHVQIDPRIDWVAFLVRDFGDIGWLPGRLMARGEHVALVGDAKAGKSLLAQEWAYRISAGLPFLGYTGDTAARVLYLDKENGLRVVQERFRSFGVKPEELASLDYVPFPQLQPLNTPGGGTMLMEMVRDYDPDVVFIDTVSRFVSGKENDSDTWHGLYNHTLMLLKAEGIATVRLDHFGKDKSLGSRGHSAKRDDVDHVWELRGDGNLLKLERTHTRTGHGEDSFDLRRHGVRDEQGHWKPGATRHDRWVKQTEF